MSHSSLGPPQPRPGSYLEWDGSWGHHRGHTPGCGLGSVSHFTAHFLCGDRPVGQMGGTVQLCPAPASIPSLPSNLMGNPGVQGTAWSTPSGSSPQEPYPLDRRLGMGTQACLGSHGHHPPPADLPCTWAVASRSRYWVLRRLPQQSAGARPSPARTWHSAGTWGSRASLSPASSLAFTSGPPLPAQGSPPARKHS